MSKPGFQTKYSRMLEDQFFYKQDQVLMEEFRRMTEMKETRESLAKVSGISNDAILQKFVELDIRPEIAASLAMVPLIEVAWADGRVEEKEKEAVKKAVEAASFANNVDQKLLTQWLEHRPPKTLLDAWTHYIQGLCEMLSAGEKANLREELVGHARQVAESAGGFLGLGSKISEAERKMLEYLESAFE